MKAIKYIVLGMVTAGVYYSMFNATPIRWMPAALIVVLVVYFNQPRNGAYYTAVAAAVVTDLHFVYLGPAIVSWLAIVLIVERVHTTVITSGTWWSRAVLAFIGMSLHYLFSMMITAVSFGVSRITWGFELAATSLLMSVVATGAVLALDSLWRLSWWIRNRYAS